MSRKRNKYRIYSSISDEQLAIILANDFERSPLEFSNHVSSDLPDSKTFLKNTSGRAIKPMIKWL